ncbi:TetR/AcrR family transcriptional regulator [Mesoterricola silvestris]|uniref:TetR family transcriptional regulator n=1 Tax=Mesoterricola silvestris TaxID=2927979 RepID=A0AA48H1I6_9BACT|nr:TetR/AcrR family transcriptional regulator [Mesoterricola silvestris]BDU74308.1 TetR family transcriptional regulator [Mesoterricola silvestris]
MHPTRKRADRRTLILDAARRLFLVHGFEGTSMEAILGEVGGSKATLYAHFPGKDALFEAAMKSAGAGPLVLELDPRVSPRTVLSRVAEKVLRVGASTWAVRMQRCVIARTEAAPEAARAFFEAGAGAALRDLAAWLAAQHRAGALHCPRPAQSAELFLGMAQGLHGQRALSGLPPLGASGRGAWVRCVVRAFLDLHRRS